MSRGRRPDAGRRRWAGRVVQLLALVVVAAVVLVAWVAVRGVLARRHLDHARALVPRLEQEARTGSSPAARADLARLQHEARAAARLTGDPGWSLAGRAPYVGDDLRAVRSAAAAVDEVAARALPPLLQVASDVQPARLRPVDGRIPLDALGRAQAPLARAQASLARGRARLAPAADAARAGHLVGPLARGVAGLDASLDHVARDTATARRAADLVPALLGADGPRTTLVLFQNPAEARSLGGIAGAFAVIEADHGALRVVHQGSAADVGPFAEPVLPLAQGAAALYQPRVARYLQNATQPIDFPTAARLAREMWRRESGARVDAVLATDPVALSYLLRATGPVPLAGGRTLDADNAVRLLLSDVYRELPDPRAQDAFFAGAALSVFSALTSGHADPTRAVDALAQAAGEHRLLVWSASPAQQRELEGTVLSGRLDQGRQPSFGVLLNDATASKMSYYLRVSAQLRPQGCTPDGARSWTLQVRLRSTAPSSGLPTYVTGTGRRGSRHVVSTLLYVVGAAGGGNGAVRLDGTPTSANAQVVDDRPVSALRVDLAPGQSRTLQVDLGTAVAAGRPALRLSPTVSPGPAAVSVAACP